MTLVLDTNVYTSLEAGHEPTLRSLADADSLSLPSIVYGELYYGFRHGRRFDENLRKLDRFLVEFDVEMIPVTVEVAKKFGDIFTSLRKKGRPIPTNDVWIAACCMEVEGILLTQDRHFLEVDQIQTQFIEG